MNALVDSSGRVQLANASDDDANALLHLLGDPWGVPQEGIEPYGYPGYPHPLSLRDLADHVTGFVTFGFAVVYRNGECRIVGIDIDERFEARLIVLRDVIRRRDRELAARRSKRDHRRWREHKSPIQGETNFEAATFFTNGSEPGRGKAFIAFANLRSRSAMGTFAASLVADARLDPRWGQERSHSVECWPTTGVAVCKPLRIGGRSRRPGAPLETFFNLDGEVIELPRVVPLRGGCTRIFACPEPAAPPRISKRTDATRYGKRVARALRFGVSKRELGTRAVIGKLYSLCFDLIARSVGLDEAQMVFARIRSISPDLDTPSATTGDARNPLDQQHVAEAYDKARLHVHRERKAIESAITALDERPRGPRKLPQDNSPVGAMGAESLMVTYVWPMRRRLATDEANKRTELTLRDFCQRKVLDASIFAITARELGRELGMTHPAALKRVEKLVAAGLLKVYDSGEGMRLPMLVGLLNVKANAKLIDAMIAERKRRKAAILAKRADRVVFRPRLPRGAEAVW